ncbi:MAG TPA: 2,3-diaminopropionate biosynthesis protein SbnB [Chitinophagaceae bacterium]|nr:2,3-diaminopropionate biosynthesis protein SbnB [Chitinophagaceae bacterium]
MRYLNEKHIREIGIDWHDVIDTIEATTALLKQKDYNQPLKPYLRFKDQKNRIIAMPAYVGGRTDTAGIKWIASFPDNIHKNKVRAHSVLVLNDADCGEPICVINTGLLSGIRTAGVTGFIVRKYFAYRDDDYGKLNAGIIGFGPIGQLHFKMLQEVFGDKIDTFYLFDTKGVDPALVEINGHKVVIAKSWQEVYDNCLLLATCTVSPNRYIAARPRKGSLYLNVSLRDFETDFMKEVDAIIVDDWEEVCRENTDIERAHKTYGLNKDNVQSITDLVNISTPPFHNLKDSSVMFNPMGMAVFDIAVARYYYDEATEKSVGVVLE